MSGPYLLCTDGSDLAAASVAAGLAVLDPAAPVVLVMAIPDVDESMVTGSGMAGGVMSAEELEEQVAGDHAAALDLLGAERDRLGRPDAEVRVVLGAAGAAVCHLAEELGARAIVVGSRGRSGIKRAVMGSVSDHIVRHAPCPVVVTAAPQPSDAG
jgi:nucleotide-binding universal stress UspA family protein